MTLESRRQTTGQPSKLGRGFNALWTASAISTLGDGVRLAALPLLAATVSASPLAVATVSFAGQLPWLVLSLLSGVIVDRADRRRVMWMVDVGRAAAMLGLAAAVALSGVGVAGIASIAFLLGCGQTLFNSAEHAIIPELLPREALAMGNSRLFSMRMAINSFIGPPVGSLLFAWMAAAPFILDGGSFAVAAVIVLLGIPSLSSRLATAKATTLGEQLREGVRFVKNSRLLKTIAVLAAGVNLTQGATQAILVLYALENLHVSKSAYGLLMVAGGIGGALAGVASKRLRAVLGSAQLFSWAVYLTPVVLVGLGLTHSAWVAGLMLALNALLGVTASVYIHSLRQAIVPHELLGRVNSVMGFLSMGLALPLGSVLGGVIAHTWGLRAPYLLSAALLALLCMAVPRLSSAIKHEQV